MFFNIKSKCIINLKYFLAVKLCKSAEIGYKSYMIKKDFIKTDSFNTI